MSNEDNNITEELTNEETTVDNSEDNNIENNTVEDKIQTSNENSVEVNSSTPDSSQLEEYTEINQRLKEISDSVEDENMSLEDSLDLYEEAVKLGIKATQTIEHNVSLHLNGSDSDNQSELDSQDETDSGQ